MKMAKRSSEEFQKVSKVSFEYLSDSPLSYSLLMQCPFVSVSARSHVDCSCSISALARCFHTSIASWADQYHVASAPFRLSQAHDLSIASWSDQYHVASSLGIVSQARPFPRSADRFSMRHAEGRVWRPRTTLRKSLVKFQ